MKNEKIDGKGEARGDWSAEQIAPLHGGSDLGREKSINRPGVAPFENRIEERTGKRACESKMTRESKQYIWSCTDFEVGLVKIEGLEIT